MRTKRITTIAMLIALSALGAFIKIPSPIATVSFDSLPGFVAAGLFSPVIGGMVGAIGHLISALYNGFPFGILSHIVVAITMFVTMFAFSLLYKKGKKILAIIVAVVINGPIGLVPFIFIISPAFYVGSILPLSIAALINVLLAALILPSLQKILKFDKTVIED